MEFGLFTEFHSPPGVSEAAAFDESLGQMKAAEDMGYDAVWLAEIHPERSIGTCVPPGDRLRARGLHAPRQDRDRRPVLPLSHPLRLAVDVATVDHISKGRLEFGVGRSGLPGHHQGFNIPYSESRDRFLETLDILTKAWTQDRFSHHGKYFQFQDVCIMPKPYQKPHPSVSRFRYAGSRRRPAARAARADELHDAVVVDEPRRDDSERACAHVDASLRRASRAAPGMSAGQSGATSTS